MARRRISRGAVALLAVVCMLLAALGGLTVYTVQKVERLQGTISQLESDLSQQKKESVSSEEVDKLEAELAEQQATIDAQQSTIEEQESTIEEQEGIIEEQQNTIEEQQNTIDDQKDTIDDLKVQIALKNTTPGDPNLPPEGEYSSYAGQKIVALTFDDGPGPYTERLLDELQARGARATFFVLGTRVDAYPKLIRRMAAEGHAIGNHSNSHKMLHKMDLLGVRNEMGKCAEKIEKLLGYRPSVMRCPGGNSSATVKQYAEEAGIPIIYWGVDTRDWESRNKDAILKVCKQNIKDGSIVLLHDIHKVSVDATIELLDWLEKEGYTMVTVPELLHARRGGIVPGKTYS